MALKRHSGENYDNLTTTNQPHIPSPKSRKVTNYVLKEVSLEEIAAKIATILEPTLCRVVKEEVAPLIISLQSSPRRSLVHPLDTPLSRNLQLHFVNKLPSTLYTNKYILDKEHAALQIMLVDARSKTIIQHGPLSSLKVEMFVLNADFAADGREDWSEDECNVSAVREREGRRPLLVGELSLTLLNGVGLIGNVAFTDNSSWVRSRRFRLGIRAVPRFSSGIGIREAVSEAFVVLDHRGESYKKHSIPSLDDPVWRLKKISKGGASHKKLDLHGVKTVKDFLMHYHINPSMLRHVLGKGVPNRAWETMVKHANGCPLDDRCYTYYNALEGIELLFNCVYKVIAVKFEGQELVPVDHLDFHQKTLVDKLKQLAFGNLDELVAIDNPFGTHPLVLPHIQQNIPSYGENLDLQPDDFSLIDQDEPGQQFDVNVSESDSFPGTVTDGCFKEDDSTAQSDHPAQELSPTDFIAGGSSVESSEVGFTWYHNSPVTSFASNSSIWELYQSQNLPLYPFSSTLVQEDGIPTVALGATGMNAVSPSAVLNISRTRKSKAGWCKVRAAVMWKIIRRTVANKRKAKRSLPSVTSNLLVR